MLKAAFLLIVAPKAAAAAARLLNTEKSAQFRVRVAFVTFLGVLNTIVLPVVLVVLIDDRCLYRKFFRKLDPDATNVGVKYCSVTTFVGSRSTCTEWAADVYVSKYHPTFDYDGGYCVSAVLATYTPVLESTLLLTGLAVPAINLLLPLVFRSPPPSSWLAWFVEIDALWGRRGNDAAVVELLCEAAFATQFVSLSLVTTIGVAAPNVAAAAIAATAGGLVGMLHMLKNATAVCGS